MTSRAHDTVSILAGNGIDYNQFRPDKSSVPKNGVFVSAMNGLMWVGFIMAGIAVVVGLIIWAVSRGTGHDMWNDTGKSRILKGALAGIALGSFGTIMNFFVAQ